MRTKKRLNRHADLAAETRRLSGLGCSVSFDPGGDIVRVIPPRAGLTVERRRGVLMSLERLGKAWPATSFLLDDGGRNG